MLCVYESHHNYYSFLLPGQIRLARREMSHLVADPSRAIPYLYTFNRTEQGGRCKGFTLGHIPATLQFWGRYEMGGNSPQRELHCQPYFPNASPLPQFYSI